MKITIFLFFVMSFLSPVNGNYISLTIQNSETYISGINSLNLTDSQAENDYFDNVPKWPKVVIDVIHSVVSEFAANGFYIEEYVLTFLNLICYGCICIIGWFWVRSIYQVLQRWRHEDYNLSIWEIFCLIVTIMIVVVKLYNVRSCSEVFEKSQNRTLENYYLETFGNPEARNQLDLQETIRQYKGNEVRGRAEEISTILNNPGWIDVFNNLTRNIFYKILNLLIH